MVKDSIASIIINNILGIIMGVVGFVSAAMAYIFPTILDKTILSMRLVMFVITLFIIVLAMTITIIVKLQKSKIHNNTFVVRMYNRQMNQFIMTTTSALQINTILGMYYRSGYYEIPIGLAKVTSDTGKAYQLKLITNSEQFYNDKFMDEQTKIAENDEKYIRQLVVKYAISEELLQTLGETI